jgi:carbon-monoxide dehydrogenase medium subunit
VRAESVDQVCQMLSEYRGRARVLAGGQSLMPAIAKRLETPELLIDINRLEAMSGALYDGKQIRIGALTRHADVMLSHAVAKYVPLLAQAMPYVAPVAVRNRGTFGGSIALSHPGAELPACLLALDARIVLQSVRGRREMAAADFFTGAGKTALEPDEILFEALIQPQPKDERSAFVEIPSVDGYAAAGVALGAHVAQAKLSASRIVLFCTEMRPTCARTTMAALDGLATDQKARSALASSLARDLATAGESAVNQAEQFAALAERALTQLCN